MIDASNRVQNSLKAAGLAGTELKDVYDALFASAQRNAVPIEALVSLYGKAALVQRELGVSTDQLLRFTDKVALALRASGQSADEVSGALLQLSQALGAGTVRAEEFNSILEGAPTIAQAVAAGLAEAGGSVAKLRQLVVDGQISSREFFDAFEAGSGILESRVAGATATVEQGMTRLANQMVDAAGKLDTATGASNQLAGALGWLADVIGGIGNLFETDPMGIGKFIADLEDAKAQLRDFLGLTGKGSLDDFLEGTNLLQGRIGFASDQQSGTGLKLGNAIINGKADPGLPAPPGGAGSTDPTGSGATLADLLGFRYGSGMKGRGGPGRNTPARPFYGPGTTTKTAAAETEEQSDAVDRLVKSLDAQKLAQDRINQAMQQNQQIAESAGQALAGALEDGKLEARELLSVLVDVGKQLVVNALSNAVPGGSIATSFLSGLFGGFRANGGSVQAGKGYIVGERGPELMVPGRAGMVIPSNLTAPVLAAAGGGRASNDVVRIEISDPSGLIGEIADRRIRTASGTIVQVAVGQSVRAVSDNFNAIERANALRKTLRNRLSFQPIGGRIRSLQPSPADTGRA